MNWEKELQIFLEGLNDVHKRAFEAGYKKGFEDGKKAKEKEYEDYFRALDAKQEEILQEIRDGVGLISDKIDLAQK